MLAVVDIPQHSGSILATGTAQGSVRRDRDGVQNARVPSQIGFQAAVVQVPNFDELVPTTRNNEWILGRR